MPIEQQFSDDMPEPHFADHWIAEREAAQALAEHRETERQEAERAYESAKTRKQKLDALAELATADWLKEHEQDAKAETTPQ